MNYALGLKGLKDGISLLSLFIENKPQTMREVHDLYHFNYVGEWNEDALSLEEYMKEIRTQCGQLATFTDERLEDVEGYADVVMDRLSMAERCGLFDCNRYAYIVTGTKGEEPELTEWKQVHLLAVFTDVTTALVNLRGKLAGVFQQNASELCGVGQHLSDTPTGYSDGLKKLFRGHVELLDELVGKSDEEIARLIGKWAKEKDKFGKPKIENPMNGLKSQFSKELKNAGIIKCSEDWFRRKL